MSLTDVVALERMVCTGFSRSKLPSCNNKNMSKIFYKTLH
jgi:hypothetical protein